MNCSQECLLYSQFRRNVLLSGQFIYQEQSQLFDDVLSTDNQGTRSNFLSLTYTPHHTHAHTPHPIPCQRRTGVTSQMARSGSADRRARRRVLFCCVLLLLLGALDESRVP